MIGELAWDWGLGRGWAPIGRSGAGPRPLSSVLAGRGAPGKHLDRRGSSPQHTIALLLPDGGPDWQGKVGCSQRGAIMPVMLHAGCTGGGKSYRDVTSGLGTFPFFRGVRVRRRGEDRVGTVPAHLVSETRAKARRRCRARPQFYRARRRFYRSPTGVLDISLFAMRKAPYGYGARLQWEGADVPSAVDRWGAASHDCQEEIGGARASGREKEVAGPLLGLRVDAGTRGTRALRSCCAL